LKALHAQLAYPGNIGISASWHRIQQRATDLAGERHERESALRAFIPPSLCCLGTPHPNQGGPNPDRWIILWGLGSSNINRPARTTKQITTRERIINTAETTPWKPLTLRVPILGTAALQPLTRWWLDVRDFNPNVQPYSQREEFGRQVNCLL